MGSSVGYSVIVSNETPRYVIVTDGAYNCQERRARCSFIIHKVTGSVFRFEDLQNTEPMYKEILADTCVCSRETSISEAEILAMHSALVWMYSQHLLSENTLLYMYTDSDGTIQLLKKDLPSRNPILYRRILHFRNLCWRINKHSGFDFWRQASLIWVSGARVKRTPIGH